jgi:hypothetical protein
VNSLLTALNAAATQGSDGCGEGRFDAQERVEKKEECGIMWGTRTPPSSGFSSEWRMRTISATSRGRCPCCSALLEKVSACSTL